MSIWGEIDAEFYGLSDWARETIAHELQERAPGAPTGSESGPSVSDICGALCVHGRLRDVRDMVTSPEVLAWFVRHAEGADRATLRWEIDDGPSYRYVYEDGELRKLKGVLDL